MNKRLQFSQSDPIGKQCHCSHSSSIVQCSRDAIGTLAGIPVKGTRRRRECRACGYKWSTLELPFSVWADVLAKKDAKLEKEGTGNPIAFFVP